MRSTLKNKRIKTREPINTGESEVVFYRNILGVHYIEKRPQESHWPIENEARILKRLKHNWTPKYVDSHLEREVNKSSPFIKMREIKGKTLEQIFQDSRLDLQDIIAYLRQLSFYLCCLHQDDRIWHLDLKPPNIIISNLGRIHLIDFGSACLTEQNKVIGEYRRRFTSGYSAPELQKDSLSPCFQSDLYSLGMIGVKLLTRKEPHKIEEELKRKKQHIDQGWCEYIHPDYRQKGNRDSDLSELISQLIARSPEARAKSTDEIYREFNRIQEFKLTSTYYSKEFRLSASFLLSSSIFLSARFLGFLEIPELYTYDYLYKVKSLINPDEPAKEIVIVAIDKDDFKLHENGKLGSPPKDEDSISDGTLLELIQTLNSYKPRVIGIDLSARYDNYPDADRNALKRTLANIKAEGFPTTIIGNCQNKDDSGNEEDTFNYDPPNEYIPAFTELVQDNVDQDNIEQFNINELSLQFIGYTDLFETNKSEIVRRNSTFRRAAPNETTPICSKHVFNSFAFQVATWYLSDFGISYIYSEKKYKKWQCPHTSFSTEATSDYVDVIFRMQPQGKVKEKLVPFPGLRCRFGGKLLREQDGGHQALLQYRAVRDVNKDVAEVISLREALQRPETVTGKIVLIGVARGELDKHTTPLGDAYGVSLHAHATSQIIDVARRQRKPIWVLPVSIEFSVVLLTALLIMPLKREHKFYSPRIAIGLSFNILILFLLYYLAFLYYSLWLPIAPVLLASLCSHMLLYNLTNLNPYYTRYWLIYKADKP